MRKIKALIADDEIDAIEVLSNLLADNEKIEIVGKVSDPFKIESAIQNLNPDILFLDIVMPGFTGLDLLKKLREHNLNLSIILVTAHQQYISEVINYQVFYCLYKPVNRQELSELIEKLALHRHIYEDEKIKLPVNNGFIYLEYDEILMLEAEGNYTRIRTTANDEYMSSYNMGRLHKKLNNNHFFRINRGCILNAAFLKKIDKKNKLGTISYNGTVMNLPLSNTFITSFNKRQS